MLTNYTFIGASTTKLLYIYLYKYIWFVGYERDNVLLKDILLLPVRSFVVLMLRPEVDEANSEETENDQPFYINFIKESCTTKRTWNIKEIPANLFSYRGTPRTFSRLAVYVQEGRSAQGLMTHFFTYRFYK